MAGRPKNERFGYLADIPVISDFDKQQDLLQTVSILEPLADMWLDEWADQFFYLPRETSAEYGEWRTDRTPYLRRPLRCLSPQSRVKRVTFMSGTQLGKTTLTLIWFLYSAERNPGPMTYIRESEDAAIEFSREKLKTTVAVCPSLSGILGEDRPHDLTHTDTNKHFPGGFFILSSIGKVSNLRGKSIRDVAADEVDAYPKDVKSEGSPLSALDHRQDTFSAIKKSLITSTPKIKETSIIEPELLKGTNERYYVPCPICNQDVLKNRIFKIEFENIKWSKDDLDPLTGYPNYVWLECPFCGERVDEIHKTWMLDNGEWYAKTPDGELWQPGYDVEHVSLRLPSFYSPLGFLSWTEIVKKFFDYKKSLDIFELQAIENQIFARTFTLAGRDIDDRALGSHKEEYINTDTGEVVDAPEGVLAITAGADVQGDRIEIEVVGWGLYGESWSLDYQVFFGNTELLGDENYFDPVTGERTVWGLLDDYLKNRFVHASGRILPIEYTLVDANYRSEPVNAYCKEHEGRRIFPCIGKDPWGKGFITRPKRRSERWGTWTIIINVNDVKDCLYQWFTVTELGPGYCHFPNKSVYDGKYFKGLTIETKEKRIRGGKTELFFKNPPGGRNEPLDCRVYAFAALEFSAINLHLRSKNTAENQPIQRPPRWRRPPRVLSKGV